MIRGILNFLATAAFTLLLPFFGIGAWLWGSPDERILMKICFCVLAPFCAVLWYILLSHLVLRRKSSYLAQFAIFVLGYAGIFFLLKERIISF
jgi:ABC-type branched-subunit amino acid transport system permease subunit